MKKSDLSNNDMLKDWVEATGKDKAPVGFTQNVMSQVNVEPVYNSTFYKSPVSTTFKTGALLFVIIIVVLAFFVPDSQSSIIPGLNFDFLNKINPGNLSLPKIDIPSIPYINYLLYASVVVLLLAAFDGALSRFFTGTKKEKALQ
ncbi:MAG: hypothetical protein K8R35_10425 [Bacteroidales bacterium]|nr:hypothetical protein [Bacteroidales bacterium]